MSPAAGIVFRSVGATLTAGVTDSGSGVAAATVTVALDASTPGSRSVTVTATDLAGNVATASCAYRVVYVVHSRTPLITSVPRSATGGKVTPITFGVVDALGRPVLGNIAGQPTSVAAPCPTGWALPMLSSSLLSSGTSNLGWGAWYSGWKPATSFKGTCRELRIPLNDGTNVSYVIKIT